MEGMKNMKRDKNKGCSTIDTQPFVGTVRVFTLKPATFAFLFFPFMSFMCFMVKKVLWFKEKRS